MAVARVIGYILRIYFGFRNTRYTVIVTAIVIVALWAGMVVTSYIDHRKNANGYAIVEIIEIDNKVTDGGEN